MDWCQIGTVVSDIALPVFTAGLVLATVGLWRSTSRYTKATKKQYDLNALIFVCSLDEVQLLGPKGREAVTLLEKMIADEEMHEMHDKARAGYNRLFAKVLDDAFGSGNVFKEFLQRKSE